MSFTNEAKRHFHQLSEHLFSELKSSEELSLNLQGEDQTYLRFNNSKVRQATSVEQQKLAILFLSHGRKVSFTLDLTGDWQEDRRTVDALLTRAREEAQALPEDPFLVPLQNNGSSEQMFHGELLPAAQAVNKFCSLTEGTDFTGLYAAGPQIRANRNSKGQSHWFSSESFFIDYSLFTVNSSGENKAVKGTLTNSKWREEEFLAQIQNSKNQLSLLKRPTEILKPGSYRVFLAPAAASELFGMLNWGAVSFSAYKKGNSAFQKLAEGQEQLSPLLTVKENFALGLTPAFNSLGEVAPQEMAVVEKGRLRNWMVSSRSAKEYGVASTAADDGWFGEMCRSMDVSPGTLEDEQILSQLKEGLYIGNLHYLNWSDIPHARITGMTRYACFWVEQGEIKSPIRDLRFDESLYRALGSELENLTSQVHIDASASTYFQRALEGKRNPGLLIRDFKFTL